jgi:hypothetical protein
MNMFFEFIIIILKIYLSRFIEIQTNVKIIEIHATRWNIWFYFFQVNEGLKDIFVFSNCAYYSNNTFNFNV